MPTYNSLINRSDAAALIPEEISRQIIQNAVQYSAVLRLFRRVTMSRYQQRMPVLSALATAYFVSGDTGLKQTSEINWENKYLTAEEMAVIVPVPQSVLDDAEFDIWGEVRPRIEEAFGRALDAAVFFGTNKPSSWPNAIVVAAAAASQTVTSGTGIDIADDLGGENGIMAKVEAAGYDTNFFVGALSIKSKLRGLRTAEGALIFQPSLSAGTPSTLYGQSLEFPINGAWNAASALMVCGDRNAGIVGVRQDMQVNVLDQAIIQDGSGAIIYNLAQQDMVALRATMRVAFQVPNPVTAMGSGYPFAALVPAS
jgi:HK97 family phage major capsid protein